MQATFQTNHSKSVSTATKVSLWIGRVITALVVAFLIFDGGIKVFQLAPAVEATVKLGYPASVVMGLGLLELACLALYLFPRTSLVGVVLMTGYLGGALATQVRVGADWFTLAFPFIIGAMLWGGLFLRDAHARTMMTRK